MSDPVKVPAQPSAPLAELKDNEVAPPVPVPEVIVQERQTGKDDPIAYTLKDTLYGDFAVLNSANGWWLDSAKVRNLLQAYKIDCTDEEACAYAGISLDQLRYFRELHEDFPRVKAGCKQYPMLAARKRIVEAIPHSSSMATWYAERKKKDEFSTRSEIAGPNGADILSETAKLDQLIKDVRTATTKPATADEPSPAPTGPTGAPAAGAPTAAGAGETGPTGATAPASAEPAADAGLPTGAEASAA